MPLTLYYASQWAFSEQGQQAANTPFWVPLTILVLILLLFVWGLTRGNVLDENLPDIDEDSAEGRQQAEVAPH